MLVDFERDEWTKKSNNSEITSRQNTSFFASRVPGDQSYIVDIDTLRQLFEFLVRQTFSKYSQLYLDKISNFQTLLDHVD